MREMRSVPHQTLRITIEQCGPEDLEPMLDRLETLLHEDYFFRRKHFAAILARPNAAVYAIRVDFDFAAIAIVYNGSTLQNLYVHPEHRRQGVGEAVLSLLNPDVVRAKGNMSQGNPVPFYEKQGYRTVGADATKPHILLMSKPSNEAGDDMGTAALNKVKDEPPVAPAVPLPVAGVLPAAAAARTVTPERLAQLARNREKAKETRKAKKQQEDYERLIRAGVDQERAKAIVLGVRGAAAPTAAPALDLGAAPTVGTLPD
jgi:GNAT superfamily N-acetyltransferase